MADETKKRYRGLKIVNNKQEEKEFLFHKDKALSKTDLSKKGSIDAPIEDLVRFINKSPEFFTTSSCSGRLILFSDACELKKGCKWHFVSHNVADPDQVIAAVHSAIDSQSTTFKFEPFILHAQCQSLDHAKTMLGVALETGFRNSGLVIGKKRRFMLAVRSSHGLEIPISFDGKILVSDEYVRHIVLLANEKLKKNFEQINSQLRVSKLLDMLIANGMKKEYPPADMKSTLARQLSRKVLKQERSKNQAFTRFLIQ